MCIDIDKIYVEAFTRHLSQNSNRVIAIYWCQIFVWEQIDRIQILYMHLYWQDLRWDSYTSFLTHL